MPWLQDSSNQILQHEICSFTISLMPYFIFSLTVNLRKLFKTQKYAI